MSTEPNPKQTLILWALLGQGGAAAQKDLGFTVDKKDRDALVKAGLLTVSKGARNAIALEVTDKGWSWANGHLGASLPSGRNATKAGTPVLQAWLKRLQSYLQTTGVPLAEVLTSKPAGPDGETDQRKNDNTDTDQLRQRVRDAYLHVTGGRFNDNVPLSRLRHELADISRETLDAALTRMNGKDGVTLMNLGNPREIEAEREAALRFKGQDMHILWISR